VDTIEIIAIIDIVTESNIKPQLTTNKLDWIHDPNVIKYSLEFKQHL